MKRDDFKRTTHTDIVQGTAEWDDVRRGMITASVMKDFITLSTRQKSKSAYTRVSTNELVAQRITGWTEPSYIAPEMERGMIDEDTARDLYHDHYAPVDLCGFMTVTTEHTIIGYSPDGLVEDDGLIEIKSRVPKHHLATILADEIPGDHMAQAQTALLVSGREWIDYVSYCAGMPLWVKRVYPDDTWRETILDASRQFEEAAQAMVSDYNRLAQGLVPTERDEFDDIDTDDTITYQPTTDPF